MPILATPTSVVTPAQVLPTTLFDRRPLWHKWTGWDGSEWLLTDPASGVRLLRGYRGVGMPTPQRYTTIRPALPGTRRRGMRMPEREVVWNLAVFTDATAAWWAYDNAFWRTMDPGQTGLWSVTSPAARGTTITRTLRCAFVDGGDTNIDIDPGMAGFRIYEGITLVAEDQPLWAGPTVTRTFDNSATAGFFSAPGDNFVIRISPGNTVSRAQIDNPGDVDAYPVYTIVGPTTSVTLGVGPKTTQYLAAIPAGEIRVIDTRPGRQSITDQAGNDRIADMGAIAFNNPIQPGKSVPLTINMVGTGAVTVSLDPLYYRAW